MSQNVSDQDSLKQSIDHLIGALTYICPEYYEVLLELTGIKNLLQEHHKKEGNKDSMWSTLLSPPSRLVTLATASQSSITSRMLLNSGLLELCVETIVDFCHSIGDLTQDSSVVSSPERKSGVPINLLPHLLRFLTSCCQEPAIKDWMGEGGYQFWFPLLSKLCGGHSDYSNLQGRLPGIVSSISRYSSFAVEVATLELLCSCVRFHPRNQEKMACLLVEIIEGQGSLSSSNLSKKTVNTTRVSGFIRQLILKMLLEDETVPICLHVENDSNLQSFRGTDFYHRPGWHPRLGAGHSFVLLSAKMSSNLQELSRQILLPQPEKHVETISEEKTFKSSAEGSTDPCDFGLYEGFEFLESVSLAAGLNVKNKRADKSDTLSAKDNPATLQSINQKSNLSYSLFHEIFGDKSLPQSWTLAQLMQSLINSGLPCGSSFLELSCRKQEETKLVDSLPTVTSLSTPLDIFAKQDGLAQLSIHLPRHIIVSPSVIPATDLEDRDADDNGVGRLPSYPTQLPLPLVSLPASVASTVPAHSLVAFGLFIRLPGYNKVLLQDRRRARYLLRLLMGTKQDSDGGKR